MQTARSILKLMRLDSSLLIALAVFVPLLVRTRDLGLSLSKAIPLLFIGACTFIANDLDDVEKDRINHPERPLPSGHLAPSFAAILYFTCLAFALFTTRIYIRPDIAFLYYALLVLSISYGYVVECFPGFKSLYVAAAISVPALIVATFCPRERRLYLIAGAIFFFVLGRELCMDLVDRVGDATSFMHKVKPEPLAITAFSSQAIGLSILVIQASKPLDALCLAIMALLLTLSAFYWFRRALHKRVIVLMKFQLFIGLYFLASVK